jgi:hypothetical protein
MGRLKGQITLAQPRFDKEGVRLGLKPALADKNPLVCCVSSEYTRPIVDPNVFKEPKPGEVWALGSIALGSIALGSIAPRRGNSNAFSFRNTRGRPSLRQAGATLCRDFLEFLGNAEHLKRTGQKLLYLVLFEQVCNGFGVRVVFL